jgi:hypothetical protein
LEQIIDYATNISAIVKGVLESGKLKKVTWNQTRHTRHHEHHQYR